MDITIFLNMEKIGKNRENLKEEGKKLREKLRKKYL